MTTFFLQSNSPIESEIFVSSPTFTDIDGDGDIDAFVGVNSGDIYFYENTGNQTFSQGVIVDDDPLLFPGIVNLNDIPDGDKPVSGNTPEGDLAVDIFGLVSNPATTDFNGDGHLDFFIGEYLGFTYYFENNGDNTFKDPVLLSSGNYGISNPNEDGDLYSFYYASPTFVDVNGDDIPDYAYIGGNSQNPTTVDSVLKVYKNQSDDPSVPLFSRLNSSDIFVSQVEVSPPQNDQFVRITPELEDLDKDGDFDLFLVQTVVGTGQGTIRYFENTGTDDDPDFEEISLTSADHPFRDINLQESNLLDQGVLDIIDWNKDGLLDAFIGMRNPVVNGGNSIVYASTEEEEVIPPEPELPDFLTLGGNGLFTIGELGGNRLDINLVGENATQFQEVTIIFQTIDGQVNTTTIQPFSVFPSIYRPPGFTADKQSSIFGNFNPGDTFRIELQTLQGETVLPQLNRFVEDGKYRLVFADGITIDVEQSANDLPIGVGNNVQTQGFEYVDLRDVAGTQQATFTLYREADFNNVAGLYRMDDVNGTVGGITPGQQGYAQAALQNRVNGLNLSVGDESVSSVSSALTGDTIYGLFIIANGSVADFLNNNPDNVYGDNLANAYFNFANANPDGTDHIRLLGNNTFGFEDLPSGGDLDFNDLIVELAIA